MRRRTDLTVVPHGPTSCTRDPTLCNRKPTLHRWSPAYLTGRLTERFTELTLSQSVRTAPRVTERAACLASRCARGALLRAASRSRPAPSGPELY